MSRDRELPGAARDSGRPCARSRRCRPGSTAAHKAPTRQRLPTGTGPIAVNTLLRSDPLLIEVLLEQSHRAELRVSAKDQPHRLGLFRDGSFTLSQVLARIFENAPLRL